MVHVVTASTGYFYGNFLSILNFLASVKVTVFYGQVPTQPPFLFLILIRIFSMYEMSKTLKLFSLSTTTTKN